MKVKRLIKKLLFLTLLAGMNLAVFGQAITVSGTVTGSDDGLPLPGVSIVVKGTTTGTATDMDGMYSISVEPDATLVFSFVGYLTQEIAVGNRTTLDVTLELDIMGIEEVVMIGYGTAKKKDATGSVFAVTEEDFNSAGASTGDQLIAGKIAGVQITQSGGAPGQGATIRIRGGSSLTASNSPLFVIDGVPMDNREITGMRSVSKARNPLNEISPGDIESITVLKDASATAIYGSRASNGVVLITTKKGKLDRLHVGYDGFVSIGMRTGQIDNLSADEFRALVISREGANSKADSLMGNSSTDWQDEIYRTSITHDHLLSLAGGLQKMPTGGTMPYRVSVGYHDENGLLQNSKNQRTTGSINLNPSILDDHLDAAINLKGSMVKNTYADWGAVGNAGAFDPTQSVEDPSSPYGGYFTWVHPVSGDPLFTATTNPVALLNLRDDVADIYFYSVNAQFNYKFHFLPQLTAKLKVGAEGSDSEGNRYVPPYAAWLYDPPPLVGGERAKYTQKTGNQLLDFYFNYNSDLPFLSSRIDVTAGYEWQHFSREGTEYTTNAYENDADKVERLNTDYNTENYLVSFFGRLNYVMMDFVSITGTLRRDGSSRFSPETRWGLFPSGAIAVDLADAPIPLPGVINQLKFRFGYGVTGQQDITDNDYPYLPAYTASENNARYMFGNTFYTTLRPEGYDANIKWEETTTLNLGLDYGFMQNRINGQVDVYKRDTKDLINQIPVPAGTNLTNEIITNVGNMTNRGIEFSINGKIVSKVDWEWELGVNATYQDNEITKLTLTDDPTYLGVATGLISGGVGNNIQIHTVGYPARSFFVYQQVYDEDGNPIEALYVDKNEDGITSISDRYRYKSPAPDYILGLNTYFRWKKLDFSATARANIGNYIYNNQYSSNGTFSGLYNSAGHLSNVTRSAVETQFENPQYFSDYYVENGSFFRLDYATLGYNLGDIVPFVSNFRVYLSGQNLFLITKYKGLDPEVFDGIDNNIYPRPRIFTLGVNVQF